MHGNQVKEYYMKTNLREDRIVYYPFHHCLSSLRLLTVVVVIVIAFAVTLAISRNADTKTCAYLGISTVLALLILFAMLKEHIKSPEWRLFIILDQNGIKMVRNKNPILELPWDCVRDIKICVGKQETSYMNAIDCFNVCIAGHMIPDNQQFDKLTSLNVLQTTPIGDSWIIYLNRGTRGQCNEIITRINQFILANTND